MQDDEWKLHLLLRKLGTKEHERYTNFILPPPPEILHLQKLLHSKQTFSVSFHLYLTHVIIVWSKTKRTIVTIFFTCAGKVNLQYEHFRLKSLTEDQFKWLIFIVRLQSPNNADIRTRLKSMLELDKDIAVQTLTTECQRLIQCNPDIRELSGPEKYLISGFGLFCLSNTGSNLGPKIISLISGSLISGLHCKL